MAVKLNKRFKKEIFDNPETKSNCKPFWSTYGPYFSNKHAKGDADILLPENGKFYLIIAQWQMFSVIIFDQLLKTLTYLNDKMSHNLTFLMKLT